MGEQSTKGKPLHGLRSPAPTRLPRYVASTSTLKGATATPQEISQLRSIVGSLNWVTMVCRPDIAYSVHRLQTIMAQATV